MSVLGDLYVGGAKRRSCAYPVGDHGLCQLPAGHEGAHMFDPDADPRGAECKHGIAGALEDGAICSGCVAERNAAILDIPLAERIATIPREHGETWGDYAAHRGYPRSDYPPGELGTSEWHEHLAWLAGEDARDQG